MRNYEFLLGKDGVYIYLVSINHGRSDHDVTIHAQYLIMHRYQQVLEEEFPGL